MCLLGRVQVADDRADETSSSLLAEDWYNYAGDEGETFDDGGDDDEKGWCSLLLPWLLYLLFD